MKTEPDSKAKPLDVASAPYDETIFRSPELVDGQRVILHAERLIPVIRRVQDRVATITRRAVKERRTIEVDVLHEELVVTYAPGEGTEIIAAEPETYSVLLRAEDVVVTKNVRVVEEIFISTRSIVESHRSDGAVRHEILEIPAFGQVLKRQ